MEEAFFSTSVEAGSRVTIQNLVFPCCQSISTQLFFITHPISASLGSLLRKRSGGRRCFEPVLLKVTVDAMISLYYSFPLVCRETNVGRGSLSSFKRNRSS
eukprot:GHVR01179880.1.p2 GENE.GHVR01179880.1~~GHVR01179880.1.p2  ORF type:complete len:101 (+),score=0.40 GHVR01179880.1:1866-2168(+)